MLYQHLTISALLLLASSKLRHLDWSIERSVKIVADRTLIVQTMNGETYTPPIHVENGDKLSINITNNLPDIGISFHWHGFMMKGYQVYDGVVGLTQCAIVPGESFLYEWEVDENPGTYWWHTHSGIPLIGHDFARGPLIVHPRGSGNADLVDYEEETKERIIFYEDLYPNYPYMDYLLSVGGLAPHPLKDLEGFYESFIRWSNGLANGQFNYVVNVEAGVKYKFRLLNGGHVFAYIWTIDGLSFTVVASDGAACQPYKTDALQIHVGERFDVEIEIPPFQENKSFFIRALTPARILGNGIYSVLNVKGTDSTNEEYLTPATRHVMPVQVLNCILHEDYQHLQNCQPITNLKPAEDLDMPRIRDDNVDIHIVDFDDEQSPHAAHFVSVDNSVFKQSVLPGKAMIRSDFIDSYDHHPNAQILRVELNKTVVIVYRSATAFPHPIHMHGHKFEILEIVPRKKASCPNDRCEWQSLVNAFSMPLIDLAKQSKRSVLKDTAIIPAGGMLVVRLVTDNPGIWAVHCHLDQHIEDGQIFILDEGNYRQSTFPKDYPSCDYTGRIPVRYRPTCVCMEELNVFKPSNMRTYFLCSEPHLCDTSAEEVVSLAKVMKDSLHYKYPRFRPEEDLSWEHVKHCIETRQSSYNSTEWFDSNLT